MPPSKNAIQTLDPAALGEMIPDADDPNEIVNVEVHSGPLEPAPSPVHYEDPSPPAQKAPSARKPAAKAPPANGSAKRDLSKVLPNPMRVYVYKRGSDGKRKFINDYSAEDLQGSGTIEVFLRRYVVPEYDYGDFHLYYYDGTNEPKPIGSVAIEAPKQKAAPVAQEKTESVRELYDLAMKMSQQNQQPQRSPAEELTGMISTMKSLGIMGENKGGNEMMLPMLMMMMNKPQQPQGPDPVTLKILERLERMEEEHRMQAAFTPLPPAPPPAPPVDPAASIAPLVQVMQENTRMMIEAFRSQKQERDPVRDLADLAKLIESRNTEQITTRDMLTLLPQVRDLMMPKDQQKDPFEKTIENFRLFKLLQREFSGAESPSQQAAQQAAQEQSSFWDFAKSLLTSDIGRSIASQITTANSQQQMADAQQMRRMQQQRAAHEVAARRAAQERALAAQNAQLAAPPPPTAQPVQTAPPPPVQPPPPPPAAQEEQEEEEGVSVPDGFVTTHAPQINNAANDAERIGAIITSFQLLATSEDFRPVIAKMFGLCKQNRRVEALEHLRDILGFFAENEILEARIPDVAVADFDRHWKLIRNRLGFPEIPEVAPDGDEHKSELNGAATEAPAEAQAEA